MVREESKEGETREKQGGIVLAGLQWSSVCFGFYGNSRLQRDNLNRCGERGEMEGKERQSKATDKSAMPARFFSIPVIIEGKRERG